MKTRVRSEIARAFEARAARAELLASTSSSAAELLRFAAALSRAQGRVASALVELHAAAPLTGSLERDAPRVLANLRDVPRLIASHAPEPFASSARTRADESDELASQRLNVAWTSSRCDDELSRAMLRPWAETLRELAIAPDREHRRGRCPFCGGAPSVGCRRGGSEGDAAARFLVCAGCGLEWPVRRIVCAACFEEDPHKLPAFTSGAHPGARIEACDTCARYVKVIDLSLDARRVPEIDDLASLALDLWAREQGLTRVEPGLIGI